MQNVFDSVCDEANHAIVFVEQSHGFYALWLQNHLNTVIFPLIKDTISMPPLLQGKSVCDDVRGVNLSFLDFLQHQVRISSGWTLAHFQGDIFGKKVSKRTVLRVLLWNISILTVKRSNPKRTMIQRTQPMNTGRGGFTENSDGTSSLTVNVVFPYGGVSKVYAHELVVRPLEDGGVQYVSNKIISAEDNAEETWHTPRLSMKEWKKMYGDG